MPFSTAPSTATTQVSIEELGTPLADVTFVVVDLETTGGSPKDSAITEIGAVKVRGGAGARRVPDPGRPGPGDPALHQRAHRHHLDDGGRGARASARCCPAFLEFARGAVLVAHNAPFDLGFLKAACAGERHRLAAGRLGRHRRPGPPAAHPRRGAQLQAGHPGAVLLAPPRRPPTGRWTTPARPSTSCTGCSSGSGPLGITSLEELTGLTRQVDPERLRKRHLADAVPRGPGVYLFRGPRDEPLYVGTSNDLRSRVRSYFSAGEQRSRITEMVALSQRVDAIPCAHDLEAAVRELRLIAEHKPRYNRRSRFPERALWVRLTEEPFPRLSVVRRVRPGTGRVPRPVPRPPRGRRRRRRGPRVAARCGSAPAGCPSACSAAPARWPGWAGAARRAPARSRWTSTPPIAAVFRAAVDHDPSRPRGAAAAPGSTGWPPRSATRTPRCSATASPSWSGRCAAGSGWSRWPPCPSWCSPGRTAPAAGTCPSSAAAGWWPRAARRGRRRCAATLAGPAGRPPRRPTGPDDELAASVDETELVLRWMEKPGTRLVELDRHPGQPGPGHRRRSTPSSPGSRPAAPTATRSPTAGRWARGRGRSG